MYVPYSGANGNMIFLIVIVVFSILNSNSFLQKLT